MTARDDLAKTACDALRYNSFESPYNQALAVLDALAERPDLHVRWLTETGALEQVGHYCDLPNIAELNKRYGLPLADIAHGSAGFHRGISRPQFPEDSWGARVPCRRPNGHGMRLAASFLLGGSIGLVSRRLAALIAAARNVLPELLHRLDLAETALATLVAGLQGPGWCWHCGHRPGHRDGCPVAGAGRSLAAVRQLLDTDETV